MTSDKTKRFMMLYGTNTSKLATTNAAIQAAQAEEMFRRFQLAIRDLAEVETRALGKSVTICRNSDPKLEEVLAEVVAALEAAGHRITVLGTTVDAAADNFKLATETFKDNRMALADLVMEIPPKKQEPYYRRFEKRRRQ